MLISARRYSCLSLSLVVFEMVEAAGIEFNSCGVDFIDEIVNAF